MAKILQFRPKKQEKPRVPAYYLLTDEEKEMVREVSMTLKFLEFKFNNDKKRQEERRKYLEELQEFEDTIGGHHKVL
jgi:hypothetical protein